MTVEEVQAYRLNICKECPLYSMGVLGAICNSKRYLNPETNEVSYFPEEGFIRGCNCLLETKTKNPSNHCVCGK